MGLRFPLAADEPAWFGVRVSIDLSDDERARVEARGKSLVALRNDLVHGFVARYDIWSVDGLPGAIAHLDSAYAEIDERFRELRGWFERMTSAREGFASILATEKGRDLILFGELVAALRAAERELSEDGWTSLNQALASIRAEDPGLSPRSEGYATWRQVLRASGQFEIRRVRSVAGTTEAWYRSKG